MRVKGTEYRFIDTYDSVSRNTVFVNHVSSNHDLPNVVAPHRDSSKLNLANTTKTGIGDSGFGET